jgi:hypothetical protein
MRPGHHRKMKLFAFARGKPVLILQRLPRVTQVRFREMTHRWIAIASTGAQSVGMHADGKQASTRCSPASLRERKRE